MRKRLEEAVDGIYPISEIYNDLAMEFVDTNSGLREAFRDGGEVGIELGYKEAIAQAKEWLEEKVYDGKYWGRDDEGAFLDADELLNDFESDMNKLWEGEKNVSD